MQRREFLRQGLLGGAGAMMLSDWAEASSGFDDYKALVVVLLHGGNDGLNIFVPTSDNGDSGYGAYSKARGAIAVKKEDLSDRLMVKEGVLYFDKKEDNPYYDPSESIASCYTKGLYFHNDLPIGTNAMMPELAHLLNEKKVAVVSNVGTLIEPATKAELLGGKRPLPPFLFSHNSQRKLWYVGESSYLNRHGWAGLLSDALSEVNGDSLYGMNISLGDTSHMLYGKKTNYLTINYKGPSKYQDNPRALYDAMIANSAANPFERLYKKVRSHSFALQDRLVDDWYNNPLSFEAKNCYGEALFSAPSSEKFGVASSDMPYLSVVNKLGAVARLAKIGKSRGLKRQIFFVQYGGFDTHSSQSRQHARLLRGLSLGLGDFSAALKEMGMEREITTFTISDFGRSVGSNGDGTDHAWGGHHMVVGGAVKGGLYGTLPSLELGGNDDISHKGRLIPTLSTSQYYATLLKWFGVEDRLLGALLPELKNFELQDIGFMN